MITFLLIQQLFVLFLIMGCGYFLVKIHLVQSQESKTLSVLTLYLIMPCVIINAFQIEYSDEIRDGFLLALFAAAAIHILLFFLAWILDRFLHFQAVEKASLIYSNAGNLIIPLVAGVLGTEWEIYASAFLCVQMVALWTHGQSLMQGTASVNWKKILCNVNLISIIVGASLFFGHISLPIVLSNTINSLASTIGPISMLVLGMLLADISWKNVFSGKRIYLIALLKMIILPGIILLFLRFLSYAIPISHARTILFISLLAVITPSATTVTQMAQIYSQNASYASTINVMTTILCILTMPLMATLYLL